MPTTASRKRKAPARPVAVAFLNTGALPAALRSKKALLAAAVRRALAPAKARGEVAVLFLGDAAMRRLNKERLGHDYVTDVISFRYEEDVLHFPSPLRGEGAGGGGGGDAPFGDIALCVPQARRQAKELGHDLLTELLTLVAHGALHLIGYDDHKPADRKKMFSRQDAVVRSLLPRAFTKP